MHVICSMQVMLDSMQELQSMAEARRAAASDLDALEQRHRQVRHCMVICDRLLPSSGSCKGSPASSCWLTLPAESDLCRANAVVATNMNLRCLEVLSSFRPASECNVGLLTGLLINDSKDMHQSCMLQLCPARRIRQDIIHAFRPK